MIHLRLILSLLLLISLSACGGGGGGSSETPSNVNSQAEYNGNSASVAQTSSEGKATITSSTLNKTYVVSVTDTNNTPVTGANVSYYEEDGDSIFQVTDPSDTYSDVLMIGTSDQFEGLSAKTSKAIDEININIKMSPKVASDAGFTQNSYMVQNISILSTAKFSNACLTVDQIATLLNNEYSDSMQSTSSYLCIGDEENSENDECLQYESSETSNNISDKILSQMNDTLNTDTATLDNETFRIRYFKPSFSGIFGNICEIVRSSSCGNSSVDNTGIFDTSTSTLEINAGADVFTVAGDTITLTASANQTNDQEELTYQWSLYAYPYPTNHEISELDKASLTLTPHKAGNYTFMVSVSNGYSVSYDYVNVTVFEIRPASSEITYNNKVISGVGNDVSLNAFEILSEDAYTYEWEIISKPSGSSPVISATNNSSTTITPDIQGEYTVSLTVNDGTNDYTDEIVVLAATEISGVKTSNYTLTSASSPYLMTDTIQVAYGTTMEIEDNVSIYGNDNLIEVFGTLDVTGTDENRVKMYNTNIGQGDTTPDKPSQININYTEIEDGSILKPGSTDYGSIALRNSIIKDISSYSYIWYPTSDCYLENNIFYNSGGISIGTHDDVKIYIRNNVFLHDSNSSITHNYIIKNWASYDTSETIVENNSFISEDRVVLRLEYSNSKMTATNNYWGTTDTSIISSRIYDQNDDLNLTSVIEFEPFLTEPHVDTPDYSSFVN